MTEKIPEHLDEFAEEYSNFDHKHPGEEAEKAVRAGTHYIGHPANNHWGVIWFEGGQFVEEVMQHRSSMGLRYGNTLQEVFEAVNEEFGRN